MHPAAARLIRELDLAPHPEGGHFRETWRAEREVPAAHVVPGASGVRAAGTAITYLLAGAEVSRLHRLRTDEVWHHYQGGPLVLHLLPRDGGHRAVVLGDPRTPATRWQAVVPAGCWFGAELTTADDYALLGCTMAPGFDHADFELADAAALLSAYPDQAPLIRRLT